ncbi:MAG: phenylacetate--CoA ligase [Dissulfurispiraceae bacterium]|jgi:phenylacetate-CoA ligase
MNAGSTLKRFPPMTSMPEGLKEHQLKGLQWTVSHAYAHSDFYRERLNAAGVKPEDIKSLEDIQRLPFTTAEDLKSEYPLPLRAADLTDIVRIHSSSGTTGKRKILSYTQKDIDDWAYMFGRCYELAGVTREDRVQICVGYGLWTAGAGFQLGCEKFGALAIPIGPGNMELQCTFLIDMQSTVVCSTGSMALLLAEEVHRCGLQDRINLKKIILGAERTSSAMMKKIKQLLGIEEVYDITGLTELYGPGTGLSCKYNNGIHYWADFYILEILDPITLESIRPGEIGEMVFTTLRKEGAPLIRYRSRDLTRLVPDECPCGCLLPRHDRILGRSDDMFIVRGVNIYPGQLDEVLSGIKGAGSEYQVHLEHRSDGRDYMTLKVEREENIHESGDKGIAEVISKKLKHRLMVSCVVEIMPYGSLPRSEKKTKRVFDARAY